MLESETLNGKSEKDIDISAPCDDEGLETESSQAASAERRPSREDWLRQAN